MAHGITKTDSIWLYRDPAWHGLGKVSTKVIKTVGQLFREHPELDWDVQSVPFIDIVRLAALAKAGGSAMTARQLVNRVTDHVPDGLRAIIRSDTGEILAVVSDRYEPYNNRRLFSFLESVLGELRVETAFSLWGGRQVGLLSRIPEHIDVGGDQVVRFMYARAKHDGTGARWVLPTAVRVLCANTDSAAIGAAGGPSSSLIFRITHVGDQEQSQQVHDAREALRITVDYGKQFKKFGDRLAKQKITERKLADVLAELYPAGSQTDRAVKGAERKREAVMAIFTGNGPIPETVGNAPGSKWCAYNAITEYEQHVRSVRTLDERRAAERRVVRAFDDPDGTQHKALELILSA